MKLARETALTLMQYVDGELAGDEKAHVEALLRDDPEARTFVAELEQLGRTVESVILARGQTFDVADDVMKAIDDEAPISEVPEVKPSRPKLVVVPGGKKDEPEEAAPAAETSRLRRVAVVAVATLALAAGVAFFLQKNNAPEQAAHKSPAPRGPVTGEVAIEGPRGPAAPESVAASEPSAGSVHVDQVQAPSHGVSVFELPETNAASSSVVVWIDESVGGQP